MLLTLAKAYTAGRHRPRAGPGPPWRTLLAAVMDQAPSCVSGESPGRAGQPDRRPDRRLARPAGWTSRCSSALFRGTPGSPTVSFEHPGREARDRGRMAAERHLGLAWPAEAGWRCTAATPTTLIAEEAAQARAGRGVRGDTAGPGRGPAR